MIYTIIGTNESLRKKALKEALSSKEITTHIRKDTLHLFEGALDGVSLFGDKPIILLEDISSTSEGKEFLKSKLKDLQVSEVCIVIDEPFIDGVFAKTLEKYSTKFFDAREEKEKKKDPFSLTNAILVRDKKSAWLEWMKIRDLDGEPVQGALWWRVRTLWEDVKSGKKSKYSEEELASMGYKLITMSHKAHRGEVDLKEELEKFVLSV